MRTLDFAGSFVAVVTPFDAQAGLDLAGFKRLVEMHVEAGTSGLVVLGSAGEAWTLTQQERELLVHKAIEFADGRIPIVAGVTRVSTEEAVSAAKKMQELGADAVMAAAPPYVIPTQDGLYAHFEKICRSVDIPVTLYNVPYRTGVNVDPGTILKLFENAGLAAYKEAGKNLSQLIESIEITKGRLPTLVCDAPAYGLIMPALALGAHGTANISGNIAPREMSALSRRWNGWADVTEARRNYNTLLPLLRLVYEETNPVALKGIMNLVGLPAGTVRPPLLPMSREKLERAKTVLEEKRLWASISAGISRP